MKIINYLMVTTDENRNKELANNLSKIREENDKLIKSLESTLSSQQEKKLYENFKANFGELRPKMKEVQNLSMQNKNEEAYAYYLKEVKPAMQKSINSIQEFANSNRNQAEQLQEQNASSAKTAIMIYILISVLGTAIIICIGYVIKTAIQRPITLIQHDIKQVADGNLVIRTSYQANDELGAIVTSFNNMLDNLQHLIEKIQVTTYEVISSTDSMLQNTKQASKISNEAVLTINEVNKQIEGQVTNIHESSTAMNDLTNGVQSVAESAATVAEVSVATTDRVNNFSKVIKHSITQMNNVHAVVEETSTVIERLIMRTQHIDKALDAITNIAEQTITLSLIDMWFRPIAIRLSNQQIKIPLK
ncbi:HAMP domain-containing methyl-accepting chemotaxis protein [Bacillus cereus]|uniref:HAMP domain-containing methyl-accepting chemotaxis protein n=1 Tax=Bacillus cereus TaxID=1396 RepID=UPI0020D240B1|nr:methyl-accepting chemotaxis protein [Bacillus cereus]